MLFSVSFCAFAQDEYFDDIYYNPQKDTKVKKDTKRQSQSNYISDFSSVDIDEYNRRGQYYLSPIDTVGMNAENGEDFVYSQKIQKYYNPTIILDNADLLEDVLNNSYGNVNIILNDSGVPQFGTYYVAYPYRAPYYSAYWGPSWSWNWGFGNCGFGIGWYDPWYWDGWGWPSYSWGWGWNYPGWGWGYPVGSWWPSHEWTSNHWRPRGNDRVGTHGSWANSTRPGYNYNGNSVHRGSSSVPSAGYVSGGNNRSGGISTTSPAYRYNGNNRRSTGTIGTVTGNRGGYRTGISGGNSRVGTSSGYNRGSSSYGGTRYNGSSNSGTTSRSSGNYRSNSSSSSSRSSGSSYRSGGNNRSGSSGSFCGGRTGGSYGGGRSGGRR